MGKLKTVSQYPVILMIGLMVTISTPVRSEIEEQITLEGQELRVTNLIGAVEILGHDGPAFEVEVRIRGRDASSEAVRVATREGRTAELAVQFPVEETTRFVYPELGRGSRTSFSLPLRKGDGSSWLRQLFAELSGERIHVNGSGSGSEMWADLTVRMPPSRSLVLIHGVGEVHVRQVRGEIELDVSSGAVWVEGVTGTVTVDTGSGAISAEDIDGSLSLETGSGAVKLKRSRGDRVLVDTSSGGVTLHDVTVEALDVDTGSGGVEASAIRAEQARIDTGSGGIEVDFEHIGAGDFEVDTGSGGIRLRLPPGASADVDCGTGSGGIHVDFDDVHYYRKEKNEARFRIGDGAARIRLETGSGSIRVSGGS